MPGPVARKRKAADSAKKPQLHGAVPEPSWPGNAGESGELRTRLAFARLRGRLRAALARFEETTGHFAVSAIVNPARGPVETEPPPPPVHPRCADHLLSAVKAPCESEWRHHIRKSLRSRTAHSHVCPLGLHCSCVPIYLGDSLVGVAKVVLAPGTSPADASSATATLALTVTLACQESYVSVLREELLALRGRVAGFRRPAALRAKERDAASGWLVGAVLDHIHRHYRAPDLSLGAVAAAVGRSEKYLANVFSRVVGQRMRRYIAGLRVDDACRELLDTERSVKEIAFDSGFRGTAQFDRAFRRRFGVSPVAYRRIFRGTAWAAAPGHRGA